MPLKKPIVFETAFATYTATEKLGEGGAGSVYSATDDDRVPFAIKLLDRAKATKSRLKRFKNEYMFGYNNQHPNILTIVDYGAFKNVDGSTSPFYVMPTYPSSLRALITRPLSAAQVLPVYAQVLDGVEAAHLKGVVHRDLKPENILVDASDRPVIADFGIAHFEEDELHTAVNTKASERLANFLYAAPEQRRPGGGVDKRADIYALGLMLNELFTGEVPNGTAFKLVASADAQYAYIDEVVYAMLKQDPNERLSSIQEVKTLLSLRCEEFTTRQRLSQVTGAIVPQAEIDDRLVLDPIKLVGVDYQSGKLILKLSQPVNETWESAFNNMGQFTALMGAEPKNFRFRNDTATVQIDDNFAQQVVDYFKGWIPLATQKYETILRGIKQKEQREQQARLLQERQELERRERVLRSIKI